MKHFTKYSFLFLFTLLLTSACGNQVKKNSTDFSNSSRSSNFISNTVEADPEPSPFTESVHPHDDGIAERLCFSVIADLDEAALESFFGLDIVNREGPATACLSKLGSEYHLRVEYEDDLRLKTYDSTDPDAETVVIYEKNDSNDFELILMDRAGFLQIKGSSSSDDLVEAELRFANLPSFEASAHQASEEQRSACLNAAGGDAQVSGVSCAETYVFPRSFWLEVYAQTPFTELQWSNLRTMAREYVNGAYPLAFASNQLNIESGHIGLMFFPEMSN